MESFSVVARLLGDSTGMVASFAQAESAANKLRAETNKLASSSAGTSAASDAWSKLGKAATVAGLVVSAVAVKMASDFDTSTNLLVTAGRETSATIGSVRDGILQIARDTGTSAMDLSSGLYILEKAGYNAANGGLQILQDAAEGAKAENVDLATMTSAVTDVLVNYGGSAKTAASTTNEIIRASGLAKTTMGEFAASLHSVVPIASSAGMSFADAAGALATLTQHGVSAQQASQNLGHLIQNLAGPTNIMTNEWAKMGLSVTEMQKSIGTKGLAGTLQTIHDAIVQHMGPDGQVIQDAFNHSTAAAQDMNTMLKQMPPSLQAVSEQYMSGSIGAKEYRTAIRGMDAQSYQMGMQFQALAGKALGFNNLLTSGKPLVQTYNAEMKAMTGGMDTARTATMLLGGAQEGQNNSFKLYVDNVLAIKQAADDTSGSIIGWQETSDLLSTKLSQVREVIRSLLINLGNDLMPSVKAAADGFMNFYNGLKDGNPLAISAAVAIGTVLVAAMSGYVISVVSAGVTTTVTTTVMVAKWLWAKGQIVVALAQSAVQALATGTAFEALGAAASTSAGMVALIGAPLLALVGVFTQLENAKAVVPTIQETTMALKELSTGDYSGVDKAFQGIEQLGVHGAPTQSINSLYDAVKRLSNESGLDKFQESLDGVSRALGGFGETEIGRIKDRLTQMGQAMADMVSSGDAQTAAQSFRQLSDAFQNNGKSAMDALNSLPAYKAAIEDLAAKSGVLKLSQDDLVQLAGGQIPAAMTDAMQATQAQSDAAKQAKEQNDAYNKALTDMGVGAQGTVDDVKKLTDAIYGQASAAIDAADKDTGYHSALQDMQKQLQGTTNGLKNTASGFDLNTAAGLKNKEAWDKVAKAGMDDAKAMAANGASQDKIQGQLNDTYNQLYNAARGFGLTKDQADALTRGILGIPAGVSIQSWMSDEAKQEAEQTKAAVDRVNGTVAVATVRIVQQYSTIGQPIQQGVDANGNPVGPKFDAHGGYIHRFADGGWGHFANAGYVSGPGTSNSDSIKAMLSDGEFVQNTKAVQKYGLNLMRSINDLSYDPTAMTPNSYLGSGSPVGAPAGPAQSAGPIYVTVEIPGVAEHFEGRIKSISDDSAADAIATLNRRLRGAVGVKPGGF